MKSKNIKTEQPNFVKDFYLGTTHVQIADNYCKGKTSEDVDKILNRISEIAVDGFRKQQSEIT